MASMSKSLLTKLSVLLAFAATMVVNFMATTGKINGISTANVSDAHPTLLTPRGYTFSIWGIIYILLLLYVLFQLFSDKLNESGKHTKIAFWFVVSSIFNIGWIFAWHYEQIILSTVVMALLLYSLTHILSLVSETGHTFGNLISLELPFGLYAGWVTVATVSNIAIFLLDIGWDGFGVPWIFWMIGVLLAVVLIALAVTGKTQNTGYPAAVIWGLLGIQTRYLPDFRYDVQLESMWIVLVMALCLLVISIRWITIIIRRLK